MGLAFIEGQPMHDDHSAASFENELQRLEQTMLHMGELTTRQFADAIHSVITRDAKLGARIGENDINVNEHALEVNRFTMRMLSPSQSTASGVRDVLAAQRIAIDLGCIAEYAAGIGGRIEFLAHLAAERPLHTIAQVGRMAQEMLHEVLRAYHRRDAARALAVWSQHQEADAVYLNLLGDLRALVRDGPQNINACTDMLLITESIELIGDHIRNIAEHTYYVVHGRQLNENPVAAGCSQQNRRERCEASEDSSDLSLNVN